MAAPLAAAMFMATAEGPWSDCVYQPLTSGCVPVKDVKASPVNVPVRAMTVCASKSMGCTLVAVVASVTA